MRLRRMEHSAQAPTLTTVAEQSNELGQIVSWTATGFLALALTIGAAWSLIVNDVRWEIWRASLLIGLAPAALVAILLAFASFRRILNAVEDLLRFDVDGDGELGADRLIPVYRERTRLINGVEQADLIEFVRCAYSTGRWSQADWRGKRFNSGRVCQNEYHARLLGILTTAGILVDAGPRRRGRLAIEDVNEALKRLNVLN